MIYNFKLKKKHVFLIIAIARKIVNSFHNKKKSLLGFLKIIIKKFYFLINSNLIAKNKITAQDKKLSPVTIANNKSEITINE